MLQDGPYEQTISNAIDDAITSEPLAADKQIEAARLDEAKAPKMLAQYVSEILQQTLEGLDDSNKGLDNQIELVSQLISTITQEIRHGFPDAPKGCYIQLEKMASRYILDNIRASFGDSGWLVTRIASFEEDTGIPLTLAGFLRHYRIDPRSIYKCATFSRLLVRADIFVGFYEPMEDVFKKAMMRLCCVDSRRFIAFLLDLLPRVGELDAADIAALSDVERRMLQMFYVTVWGKAADEWDDEALSNLHALSENPTHMFELLELLRYQFDQIDFIDEPVDVGFDCPLDLHCSYTRDQLLVALDFLKPSTVREGVKWLPDKKIHVLFVTLNKSDKDYSPTTMYEDYSISEELFHWQSQSTTSTDSPTGQRYIHHEARGSRVLLFVREFKQDRVLGSAAAYTYLGCASYVSHEGSRPMSITWALDRPIPAKYLKKTNKLVVG